MILVIDIGNTTIAFSGFVQKPGEEETGAPDLERVFEKKLSTEIGRDVPLFVNRALRLLLDEPLSAENADAALSADFGDSYSKAVLSKGEGSKAAPSAGTAASPAAIPASAPANTASGSAATPAAGSAADSPAGPQDDGSAISLIAISSVVPTCTPAAIALSKKLCSLPPVLVSNRLDTGISLARIPAPETVGADRLADMVWAAARCPLPVMTVDLGTATTINVIGRIPEDPRPAFLGGMIGAGVRTSLMALRALTAQLPALEPEPVAPEDLIGTDTKTNMLSSAVVGTAAMIEGMAERVEEQLGEPVTLLLTGGNARVVTPWLRRPFAFDPDMTAKGTAMIALRQDRQRKKGTLFSVGSVL